MTFIPNIPIPFPDEITYSYMTRTAEANCLSLKAFYKAFVSYDRPLRYFDSDMLRPFSSFLKLLEGSGVTAWDLLDTTLIPVLAPFMRDEKRDSYILKACGYPETLGIANSRTLIGRYCYCPLCRQEDYKAYGTSYLHRMHHLPGVSVCLTHRVPLVDIKSGAEVSRAGMSVQDTCTGLFLDLLKDPVVCSYEEMRKGLVKRLSEMAQGKSPYVEACDLLHGIGYTSCKDADDVSSGLAAGFLPVEAVMNLAGYCFESAAEMRRYICHTDDEDGFRKETERLGFNVKEYSPLLAQILHRECGTGFYAPPSAFRRGMRCPVCDSTMTSDALFQRIAACTDDGYRPETEYRGPNRKIRLRHCSCGNSFEVMARRFLYDGRRCGCGRAVTREKAASRLAEKGPYTLLEYDSMDGPVKIRSDACGHIFRVNSLRKFLDAPYCRTCRPAETDEEIFRHEIMALTGMEYGYISGYEGRTRLVKMRHHSVRGDHDFSMMPASFLSGRRCPYCKKQVKKKDFMRTVWDLSSGRYEVTGFSGDTRCRVLDRENGKEREFERGFVLQELQRPTPSEVLPHIRIDTSGYCRNTMEKVLKAAREMYPGESDEIKAGEIAVDGMTRTQVMRVVNRQLTKAGYVVQTRRGIYRWRTENEEKK